MSLKSSMQMLNLGLSIFGKLQTMQHRQLTMAQKMSRERNIHNRKLNNSSKQNITLEASVQETLLSDHI